MHKLELCINLSQGTRVRHGEPFDEEIIECHGDAQLSCRDGKRPQTTSLTGEDNLARRLPVSTVHAAAQVELRNVSVPFPIHDIIAGEEVLRGVRLPFVRGILIDGPNRAVAGSYEAIAILVMSKNLLRCTPTPEIV